jgi:hypothetical protein
MRGEICVNRVGGIELRSVRVERQLGNRREDEPASVAQVVGRHWCYHAAQPQRSRTIELQQDARAFRQVDVLDSPPPRVRVAPSATKSSNRASDSLSTVRRGADIMLEAYKCPTWSGTFRARLRIRSLPHPRLRFSPGRGPEP